MENRDVRSRATPWKRSFIVAAVLIASADVTRAHAQNAPAASATDTAALHREIVALNAAMVAAFKRDPASVAAFYTDDARIVGGGTNIRGRQAVDGYWAPLTGFADWSLQVLDFGGHADSPWVLGRSTLTGSSGRAMVTDFLGVLRRMPDGSLKYAVDFYTSASRPQMRQPPPATP